MPRLLAIWEAAVRASHDFLSEDDIQLYKPLVRDVYLRLPGLTLACVRDEHGDVAGFIGIANGSIEMLFVDPASHRQGMGRALLTHALDEHGATRVDANEQNTGAIGFYTRMGFVVESRSPLDGTGRAFPILHMRLASG
ncbi:acetyltransferase [Jeongeupia sp. HS-3]|nr:acetyltransferase [Jeongeupia sp. HS-3]